MDDKVMPGPVSPDASIREATCIHTNKIYDSCQAKDCIEDLRFYPTIPSQRILETATTLKNGKAELIYVQLTVESVGLGRGFFSIGQRFFYRASCDVVSGCHCTPISGLLTFGKRSMLFGGENRTRTFSSNQCTACGLSSCGTCGESLPEAVIEAVDPIVLSMRLCEAGSAVCPCDLPLDDVPLEVLALFDGELQLPIPSGGKRVFYSLGQFSILRLERDSQLLIPIYDHCMPEKECECDDPEDDPCQVFQQVDFPVSEFFPTSGMMSKDPMYKLKNHCACS